jgi:hypothetical protein
MGDQTIRMRMELLAERLLALSKEHDVKGGPDAEDADWHQAQAAAYAHAANWIRQELAKD